MKGIILAGGFGTRLEPLTAVLNKHLLPVYDRPMILYPLELLRRSGIREVLIVSEEGHLDQFKKFLKDGEKFGVTLTYAAQRGAGGIAAALSCAEKFAGQGSSAVILGDNIFERDFRAEVAGFREGAHVFLKKTTDPQRFGVPVFASAHIAFIEEKPTVPQSDLAVTGFYLFDRHVFEIVRALVPSRRGELEITDAINAYAKQKKLHHGLVDGFWIDAGTFPSLLEASVWAAAHSPFGA